MNQISRIKTMRMRVDLIQKVEKMAKEQNRNFTNMVETILLKEVGKQN